MPLTADTSIASPALTGGRGLKHVGGGQHRRELVASPALTGGRGLKLDAARAGPRHRGIARPHRRAWVETSLAWASSLPSRASPALTGGRGLKHWRHGHGDDARQASPALTGGRGLKRLQGGGEGPRFPASPALTGGRGLKHVRGHRLDRQRGIARPHRRAWVETLRRHRSATACPRIARPHRRAWVETAAPCRSRPPARHRPPSPAGVG